MLPIEEERDELLLLAWGLIANAGGGDWTAESEDWQEAAIAWRERWHAFLDASRSGLK